MELFGVKLMDINDFGELVIKFALNTFVIYFVVRFLYYKAQRRKDYLFTYMLLSTVIFLLCSLLGNVKLELGFALGLFAVFGILRYRTQQLPIKEMTYLFLVIGISVINALANKKISYAELIFTNAALVGMTYVLERMLLLRHESRKVINYERIELIKPEYRAELIRDLEARTGLKINKVEVGKIDFLRDTARLNIYYFENSENFADDETGGSDGDD
jgi:hypothetical protein